MAPYTSIRPRSLAKSHVMLMPAVYVQALHGEVSQGQREKILSAFRDGRFTALVATDVAARGLDIADVDLVCPVWTCMLLLAQTYKMPTLLAGVPEHACSWLAVRGFCCSPATSCVACCSGAYNAFLLALVSDT